MSKDLKVTIKDIKYNEKEDSYTFTITEKAVIKAKPKLLMTRQQFEKLKKGSVLLSKGGRRRTVLDIQGNGYIKITKLSWGGMRYSNYVGYLYSDICYTHKVIKY